MKIIYSYLLLILLTILPLTSGAQEASGSDVFDQNFTHVVYFWLQNPDDAGERNLFETALKKLFSNSLYTKTNFIGTPPKAIRDVVDDSFTYAMIVTFESAAAQQAYQKEKAHLAFIEEAAHLLKHYVVYDAVGLEAQ